MNSGGRPSGLVKAPGTRRLGGAIALGVRRVAPAAPAATQPGVVRGQMLATSLILEVRTEGDASERRPWR